MGRVVQSCSEFPTIPNLVLAGAHAKTFTVFWSIEAAIESGKLAAKVYESDIKSLASTILFSLG
jgi:hypothetical protein